VQAFAAPAIVPTDHLAARFAVRVPVDDWAAASWRVHADPRWQGWVAERRRNVTQWFARAQDRPEWIAGWAHDLVAPDGRALAWSWEAQPALGASVAERALHAAWVYGLRIRQGRNALEAARLHRLTGAPELREAAASVLDFYATNLEQWPIQTRQGRSRLMAQSLDDAVMLLDLVETARLLEGQVAAERSAQWNRQLFRPLAELVVGSARGVGNITAWQLSATGVVALRLQDPVLLSRVLDGPEGLGALLSRGVQADGLWFEGSLAYGAYVVRAVTPLLEALARDGLADQHPELFMAVRKLMLAPLDLRFPDGRLPNPGDSLGDVRVAVREAIESASRVLALDKAEVGAPTLAGADKLSWPRLIDPAWWPSDGQDVVAPVTSRVWHDSRMAVLRQGDWQVFLHWGQASPRHAQREALNIEVYESGGLMSRDVGTTAYGSPLHKTYFSQAVAHNVPLADDQGQGGPAAGALLSFDADQARVSVAQPGYNDQVAVVRTLQVSEQSLLDELSITPRDIAAPAPASGRARPASVGQLWHFDCRLMPPPAALRQPAVRPAPAGFELWRDLQAWPARDSVTIGLDCGRARYALTVALEGPFELMTARAPSLPTGDRSVLYVRQNASRGVIRSELRRQPD
jgi:oligo-alginate lyase